MTPDQLKELREIRDRLDDIRGNEEEVKDLKTKITNLIEDSVEDTKRMIEALYKSGGEE